MELAQPGGQQ
jgi:hypothetical protein